MKSVVIPSEYNPFHNGHQYQVQTLKNEYGFDCVVAVMSGSCVQRGDFAVFDKKTRARAAVEAGVDLVVQLPFVYAAQNAEMFAYGAVTEADKLKCGYLCCGAENPERKTDMIKAAEIIESEKLNEMLYNSTKTNIPYAQQRINALCEFTGIDYGFLKTPNNILALEYLRAIIRTDSDIEPIFIKRNSCFISSSQIREMFFGKADNIYDTQIPDSVHELYNNAMGSLHSMEDYKHELIYLLTVKSASEINEVADAYDGIGQRFKRNIGFLSDSVDAFVHSVNTKTVPNSRIRRILMNMLMNYTQNDYEFYRKYRTEYIRILATDSVGREKIRELKSDDNVAVITKLSKALSDKCEFVLNERDIDCIKFDIIAEDIMNVKQGANLGEDIRYSPWIMER